MVKSVGKRFLSIALVIVMVLTLLPVIEMSASAASVTTGVEGLTADSSGNATWTSSGGTITGSVKASSRSTCTGTTYTAQTGTLTFTNSSGATALLSFDYNLMLSGGNATVDGANAEGGVFSKKLASGETVAVVITSNGENENLTTITISSLKLTPEGNVDVTFNVPTNGSYTVDGTAVTSQIVKTVKTTDSVALAATAVSGYKFFGWYSETNTKYFAFTAAASVSFTEPQVVVPVFVKSSEPAFQVGSMLYTDLNAAVSYAQSEGHEKITLVSNGTLPAGNYTIPNGKTLLIPMDAAYTMVKATPSVLYNSYATPSAFRVLTMASGANITVQSGGAISLASDLSSKGQLGGYNGTPTGPDGRINMQSGSTITVQNGGNLYAWGYIYGSGAVTAESGATVYEAFQVKDWRGGTATSSVYSYAFIFNQYYVQNIEVPLTLYEGATEKLYSSVNASSAAHSLGATFVGSGGMFNITSGYIVKDYIESTDRLQVDAYGSVSVTPMRLTGLPIIGSISTDEYILPITSNITINIHDGVTANITQNIEMLPSVEINVDNGATLNIPSGKMVYVYDNDNWGNFTGSARLYVIGYSVANGTKAMRTAASLNDAKIDVNGTVNVSGNLYTSEGGANITSSEGTGKIVYLSAPGTSNSSLDECSNNNDQVTVTFNPARLHNGVNTEQYVGTEEEFYPTSGIPARTEIPYSKLQDKWGVKDPEVQTFTVIWKDENGTVLETDENVEEGALPEYNGEIPTKAEDANNYYVFSGWDKALEPVSDDVIYTAQLESKPLKYHVNVYYQVNGAQDEETTFSQDFRYDKSVRLGAEDKYTEDGQTYFFSHWDVNGEQFAAQQITLRPGEGGVTLTAQAVFVADESQAMAKDPLLKVIVEKSETVGKDTALEAHKLVFTLTQSVPNGTAEAVGFVVGYEPDPVLNGDNVFVATSDLHKATSAFTTRVNVTGREDQTVYVRAYLMYDNGKILYSDSKPYTFPIPNS